MPLSIVVATSIRYEMSSITGRSTFGNATVGGMTVTNTFMANSSELLGRTGKTEYLTTSIRVIFYRV